MSTDRPPLDDLDLSAVLDGEADDDVVARLQGDAAARDRLERLGRARDAIAGSVGPELSGDDVDRLISNALAAYEPVGAATAQTDPSTGHDTGGRTGADGDGVVPVPITQARSRQVPPWAVAAVVVVLVGLGLTLVWTGRDDGGSDSDLAFQEVGSSITADEDATALSAEATDDQSDDASASAGAAEMNPEPTTPGDGSEGAVTTTTAGSTAGGSSPTLMNLGEFPDVDALRVHLRDAFPTEGVPGPLPDTGVEDDLGAAFRCLGKVDGLFEPTGEPTGVGIALVAGEPTVVYDMPYRTDDGRDTTLVIAVNEISCIPVLTFQR